MNLDEKIKKIRKDNKMSQDDLAEVLNVTRQTISNWENGKNYPDIETLIEISNKFNISLDILLKENMNMVKEIDKNVKNTKKYKLILISIISIIVIIVCAFGIYGIKYLDTKDKLENKFNETLEENNFYKNRDGYYSMNYNESITFGVPNQKMPKFLDFSLYFYNTNLYCNIDEENTYTEITWTDVNEFTGSTYSKDDKIIIGSTENLTKTELKNTEKLSSELKINVNTLQKIIDKGNDLYKEFYK